jgi:hypothetical protein
VKRVDLDHWLWLPPLLFGVWFVLTIEGVLPS